jgi:hypothetical protein
VALMACRRRGPEGPNVSIHLRIEVRIDLAQLLLALSFLMMH